ncbi:MAG: NADH-quinone oxidoreductase subunit A [Bacteroidales bacterium]|jgi:NADH-quinone oxidoreductase subunit A|nr:NADH-quinone oxidoreductase subunit A [Bacteroidales bacterium]MDD2611565.1 NADH-quinone oxidoreductase subunit A [Bacteroidales bacterium]MDD3907112.1 NADH-quinone oxidoreductase subunit A [Bacteroidales bacterium]MDD4711872.1 NADH-quinone oxidoreductase subunit A [Bacteroidales bacterium]
MDYAYFLVTLITAIVLVIGGLGLALLISPRSNNPQKREAYESGIPTRGTSWMQFRVGYYLYAILYLMFDVETVFLFPWAVVVRDLSISGLVSILFFLLILVLGLAYAWKKGALEWK